MLKEPLPMADAECQMPKTAEDFGIRQSTSGVDAVFFNRLLKTGLPNW
jgi:hypothetical protein